jgi:hypothetical protein
MTEERKETKLRISYALWEQVAAIAKNEGRSVNAQIEYFVAQCVSTYKPSILGKRKKANR